jgi:hypothetical protein
MWIGHHDDVSVQDMYCIVLRMYCTLPIILHRMAGGRRLESSGPTIENPINNSPSLLPCIVYFAMTWTPDFPRGICGTGYLGASTKTPKPQYEPPLQTRIVSPEGNVSQS